MQELLRINPGLYCSYTTQQKKWPRYEEWIIDSEHNNKKKPETEKKAWLYKSAGPNHRSFSSVYLEVKKAESLLDSGENHGEQIFSFFDVQVNVPSRMVHFVCSGTGGLFLMVAVHPAGEVVFFDLSEPWAFSIWFFSGKIRRRQVCRTPNP